eukprot:9214989-Ditylum_brightwellii.AAC.1
MLDAARAESREPEFDWKLTEKDCCFVIHTTMTYQSIGSYLKGVYLTLDLWHPNQDKDGWRQKDRELMSLLEHLLLPHDQEVKDPKLIRALGDMAEASSNRLKITNLVDDMEHEGVARNLCGTKRFIFTDNSNTENKTLHGVWVLITSRDRTKST